MSRCRPGLQRADRHDTWRRACMAAHRSTLLHAQFFARGIFAWPTVTGFRGQQPGLMGTLRTYAWAARALALSGLDWPLRRLSHGSLPCTAPALHAANQGLQALALAGSKAERVLLSVPCRQVDDAAACGASRAGQL